MTNPVTEAILRRRTIRAYKDTPLSRETLEGLLSCAMWAPSGRNSQPCHVRVLRDKRLLEELDVKVSRLAYGIPVGADIEYADEVTLSRAMEGRRYFG